MGNSRVLRNEDTANEPPQTFEVSHRLRGPSVARIRRRQNQTRCWPALALATMSPQPERSSFRLVLSPLQPAP